MTFWGKDISAKGVCKMLMKLTSRIKLLGVIYVVFASKVGHSFAGETEWPKILTVGAFLPIDW